MPLDEFRILISLFTAHSSFSTRVVLSSTLALPHQLGVTPSAFLQTGVHFPHLRVYFFPICEVFSF